MNTSYKHNITLLFLILASLPAFGQFRMIGTASWTVVTDSTYSGTINFQVDLTGKGYLATSVVDTFRVFTGTEQIYTITSVGTKTFSSAQVTIKEYNGDHGIPIGQVMVYDPAGKTTLPQAPFGSTGSTAQLQAAIDTYNARLLSSAGVDLTPYSTTLQMRQEISDSIATVTGLADGDKGDITVSGSGATWTIDANAVDADNIATNAVGPDEIAPSGVAAASYTAPNITVDQDGRITSATSNTTLVNRAELGDSTAAIRGDMLTGNETITLSGDVTGSGTTAITTTITTGAVGADELASTAVTPGSYTHASITVDADGRVTAASSGTDSAGMVTFDVIGDAGTAETISDGEELYLRGQFGVNTSNSATDIINFNIDSSEVATLYALGDTSTILRALINSVGSGSIYVLYAEDFYTADWSAAIQTAIDSLNGLGGGLLFLPPDTLELQRKTSTGTNDYCVRLKSNVSLFGHNTFLKIADGQVTNTYPTTHMFYGANLHNVRLYNLTLLGNTAGQTGYTGGYQQATSASVGIHTTGSLAAMNSNIQLENITVKDFWGAGVAMQYINTFSVRNYSADACGECLETSTTNNTVATNLKCNNAQAGDGLEFGHTNKLTLTGFQVDSVLNGAGLDIYGGTDINVSGGTTTYCNDGVNLHHPPVGSGGSGFIDSIYNAIVSDVRASNCTNYGLNMDDYQIRRTTIQNFVSRDNGDGALFGRSVGAAVDYEVTVLDCVFDNNDQQGAIIYNPWLVEMRNCSFSNNGLDGINYQGPALANSQDSVGTLKIYNSVSTGNADFAVRSPSATYIPTAFIEMYMADNNTDGGTAAGRNVSWGLPASKTVEIVNTKPYKVGNASNNFQYVAGEKKLFHSGADLATLTASKTHRQKLEVEFLTSSTITHTEGGTDKIRTKARSNLNVSAGDVVRFLYNTDSLAWFESDVRDLSGTETISGSKIFDGTIQTDTIKHNGNLRILANNSITDTVKMDGYFELANQMLLTSGTAIIQHLGDNITMTGGNFTVNGKNIVTNNGYGVRSAAPKTTGIDNSSGLGGTGIAIYSNNNEAIRINTSGLVGIGINPTSRITLPAGAATASTAPLKFTSGTNLTTPEAGAVEYDGTNLYFTPSTATRKTIAYGDRIVEANTAGSGSPNILTSTETNKVLTNEGSAAQNYHTLPTAVAGLTFTFVVQDADGIRVVANTGDTIRVAGTVSASAGYTESTTVGDAITLVAINATEWIAISYVGTWTTI